ncbi:hypothetical protein VTI74DRAFT_3781 [Chaetomium olivicolor]
MGDIPTAGLRGLWPRLSAHFPLGFGLHVLIQELTTQGRRSISIMGISSCGQVAPGAGDLLGFCHTFRQEDPGIARVRVRPLSGTMCLPARGSGRQWLAMVGKRDSTKNERDDVLYLGVRWQDVEVTNVSLAERPVTTDSRSRFVPPHRQTSEIMS